MSWRAKVLIFGLIGWTLGLLLGNQLKHLHAGGWVVALTVAWGISMVILGTLKPR